MTAVASNFTITHVYARLQRVPSMSTTPETSAVAPNGTASAPASVDIAVPAAYCSAAAVVEVAQTPSTSRHRLNPSQATEATT